MDFATLRAPEFAGVRSARGLYAEEGYLGPYLIASLDPTLQAVEAGKVNRINVSLTTPIPPNASIDNLEPKLRVGDAVSPGAASAVGVSVTKNGDSKDPASGDFQVAVSPPPRPRNVKLSLAGAEPFWTNGGVLTENAYDLPGLAFKAALNTFLDKRKENGNLNNLSFEFTTDAPGRVSLDIQNLRFSLLSTQHWTNELDNTTRVDRTLTLDYGSIQELSLDALPAAGKSVSVQSTEMDVGGQLKPDRLLGPIAVHDHTLFAIVDSDYTIAQKLTLSEDLLKGPHRCTAVTALLSGAANAELYVELQADSAGFPASGAPLAKSNVKYTPPAKTEDFPTWTVAPFAAPAELKPGTAYWIVMKGVSGSANLALGASPAGATVPVRWKETVFNRGGAVWMGLYRPPPKTPPVALMGVVYLPGSDDQTAAIEVEVRGTAGPDSAVILPVDPRSAPTTVQLDAPSQSAAWNPSSVTIRSHAQGTVNIANLIRTYRYA
jgi:hypothetical protein